MSKRDEKNMSAEHIAALVSPATKLIELVASGIGSAAGHVFAPYISRRHGKALEIEAEYKAGALLTIAQAHQQARDILDNPEMFLDADFSVNDSIEQFVNYQQERRIKNIGSVAFRAAELLEDVEEVPDKEVDHDWTARFFNEVQDVSSEEMQELWAKVLAREVESPGSTSVKTLNILRDLNRDIAQSFQHLCSISSVLFERTGSIVDCRAISLGNDAGNNALKDFGLSFAALNRLNEHGLIISSYHSYMLYNVCIVRNGKVRVPFVFQAKEWGLVPDPDFEEPDKFEVYGVATTEAGSQLWRVVSTEPVPAYETALRAFFESQKLRMVAIGETI